MTERFERIQTAPAYALVAEAIEREILSGRIVPGERIGTEASLGRQFGVNRSTIREGIRLLEQSGLLRRDGSRRLCASLPRYNKLASRIGRALVLHQVTFRELWESIVTLEPASAELAARNATPGDIEAMEDNVARSRAAGEDPAALVELDCEFHVLIARASGNRVLELAREPAAMLFSPATEMIFRSVPEGAARLIAAHGHVVDAIRRRDAGTAALWMRRHVEDFRKGFARTGKDFDRPVERLYLDHLVEAGVGARDDGEG